MTYGNVATGTYWVKSRAGSLIGQSEPHNVPGRCGLLFFRSNLARGLLNIGATGFFAREVQLLAGTAVLVQFCRGQDEVSVRGIVYAHYAGLGLSVEFQESSGLAVQRLASLLAA